MGYTPIADFVVQSETGIQIKETLKVLTSWNLDWKPKYSMRDFSDAEIVAVEPVFPESQVYLCDFHHKQCWERRVKDKSMGSHLLMVKFFFKSSAAVLGDRQNQMVHLSIVTSCRQ